MNSIGGIGSSAWGFVSHGYQAHNVLLDTQQALNELASDMISVKQMLQLLLADNIDGFIT